MVELDYGKWCDDTLDRFDEKHEYREVVGAFLNGIRTQPVEERDLITAYRRALAQLAANYKSHITPSTFKLNQCGKTYREEFENHRPSIDELVATPAFPIGVSNDKQFVPLPRTCRQANPELAQCFDSRYREYKRLIVLPLVAALRSCHGLVVFVDVTEILQLSVGAYNDTSDLLCGVVKSLNPGISFIGKGIRPGTDVLPHQWRPAWLDRIAIVATKADLVAWEDRDKLKNLARDMTERISHDFGGLKTDWFSCSAAVSTEDHTSDSDGAWLEGRLVWDAETGKVRDRQAPKSKFQVSRVPVEWPDDWPPPKFEFPEVYPDGFKKKRDRPPRQINVDKVFEFLFF